MKTFFTRNRVRDIVLALILTIFFITLAVNITLFFKPLYYFDIGYLHIDELVNMDAATIRENYDILIRYQSIFYTGALEMPDFPMSATGAIHFAEVKSIFVFIQVACVVSGVVSIPMIYKNIKDKQYNFLRLTAIIAVVLPLVIGMLVSVNFDGAFIMFHKLVFNNDYWVFDYRIDPVIQILPETFFMHCFILIIVIVLVCSLICWLIYRRERKKILESC